MTKDTKLWIGVLAGVAGTFLVLGGLAVVTATTGGMGPMGMGDMGSMMAQCQQMMDEHEHGAGAGDGNGDGNATQQDAHPEAVAPDQPDPVPLEALAGST